MTTAMRSRVPLLARVAAVLATVGAVLFGLVQPSSAATYVPISGAGSTWQYPAIHTWLTTLDQQGLAGNYEPNGSQSGLALFAQGMADWAASEFPYGTAGTAPPGGRGYTNVPDTAGGVALMYNLSINGQRVTNLRLSGATIAGIFTGTVTTWNDPEIAADNPGLTMPATPITPVVRTDQSGETAAFTRWLAATQSSAWTAYCQKTDLSPCGPTVNYPVLADSAMIGQPGDPGVGTYVAQASSNGAIGITPYAWALQEGFPVAKVLNAAGYYTLPSPGNVGVSLLAATSASDGSTDLSPVYTDTDPRTYELSYDSYMVVPTDLSNGMTTDKGYTLGAFGQYALCQGQQQVNVLGYAPLPENLVEEGFTGLAKIPGADVPTTTAAILQSCDNPTFTADGTDTLLLTTPLPTNCDEVGVVCATIPVGTGQVATTTSMAVSPSPGTTAQVFTLVAGVAPASGFATPTGTVQFRVGPTLIGGPVTVAANGVATTTTTFAAAGTESLSAAFTPADPAAFGASTGTFTLTVNSAQASGGIPLMTNDPPNGAFTLTVDTTDTVTLAVSGQTATAPTTPVIVSDTRNTFPGWAVTGQSSDFTGSGTADGGTIAGDQLGWLPTATVLGDAVTLGPAVAPASPGLGATPAILASAPEGHGFGTSTLGASLTLAIPGSAPAGPYTAGLTVTAVTSSP
jgi:phosphate ABC transporter phosphate-binding protein